MSHQVTIRVDESQMARLQKMFANAFQSFGRVPFDATDELARRLAGYSAPVVIDVVLSDNTPRPVQANRGDAGLDLTSTSDVMLAPGETKVVGTGVKMAIPYGYFGLVAPRSGLATNYGITLANSPSIIDAGYRGEIKLPLRNESDRPYLVEKGKRVAQMAIIPCLDVHCRLVDILDDTERGEGGFGSTGIE